MQDTQNLEHFPATQENYDPQSVPETAPVEAPVQNDARVQEDSKERNFRQLREKAERLERERDDAMRLAQSLQNQKQHVPDPDDIGLADDDLVERKHVDKIVEKKLRAYQEQLNQYELNRQHQEVLTQCKDWYSVVSQENLDRLREQEPEIAMSIATNPNLKSQAIATYNIMKKLGYDMPTNAPYADDIARIQRNATKPKPLAAVNPQQGDSPLSHANAFANGLTQELQDKLRKEMVEARRGY